MMSLYWTVVSWQQERFGLLASQRGLLRLTLPQETPEDPMAIIRSYRDVVLKSDEPLSCYGEQLRAYLAGHLRQWTIPLDVRGTDFQLAVWRALEDIPYGTTWTYRQVAEVIGRPSAPRAVGAAVGRNPLPLVIPCHRVVGSNGTLTGFRGGLLLKERLLALEGVGGISTRGHARFSF